MTTIAQDLRGALQTVLDTHPGLSAGQHARL
jgi:hypothetical protein